MTKIENQENHMVIMSCENIKHTTEEDTEFNLLDKRLNRKEGLDKWIKFDYQDQSTWPDNGDCVIVTIDPEFLEEIGCENKTYFADFTVRRDYCDFEVYYCDEASGNYAVTHWMPMPEPPANKD